MSRRIGIAVAVMGIVTALIPAALAAPPDESGAVVRSEARGGFIYWSDGYMAIAGASLDQVCSEPEPTVDGTFISPGNGSSQEHGRGTLPVIVFSDPSFEASNIIAGFVFLDEQCPLDSGDRVEPVASGEARLRTDFRVDAKGVVHSHNSLVGQVTTSDGHLAHLSTFAQLTIDAATGDLIELKQLRVNYTG